MRAIHLLPKSERKAALREAILRRAPGISSDCLDCICDSVNSQRSYFIKTTANKQKFLNLVTRETIIGDNVRSFSEVLPLYGCFQSPYFEKIGDKRQSREGDLDSSGPAAAVKIRAGTENKRSLVTYSLIIFLPENANMRTNHF